MEAQEMRLNAKIAAGWLLACRWLSAVPGTCVPGTLADYVALGAQGCTINGNVFANFSYRARGDGGATTITADQIMVTPLVVVPAAAKLNFSAPWSVDQQQTQDSVISYTIVPPPDGPAASQLQVTLGTASVAGIIGAVAVHESTNVGDLNVFTRCMEVCQTNTNGSLYFDPVSVVLVRHQVNLSGGTGGASLKEFRAAIDRCPLCV